MTRTRLQRAEEIFFAVSALEPAQRPAALRAACEGDEALRQDVESLLEHAAVPAEFLAEPAFARVEPDPMIGRLVGHFRIKERLASGGMGTVYLGVRADGSFEQEVAIKLVKRGMDTDEIIRRFRTERQTLAQLSHPNIAALIDGGATGDDRPYLVMEFVRGVPIDRYCQEHHLDTSARLRLFLQVCRAVQSAHQHLVVHRDLKPGNILVTGDGVPKLLDFGIAKVLEAPSNPGTAGGVSTMPEQRRLTPEYASPEQIQGLPVTTAGDVYSLGVILYELLSGQRPYHFRTRTTAEFERVVCHVEPPLPSSAVATLSAPESGAHRVGPPPEGSPQKSRKRLRGDLDTIVLVALRKEPQRRYASVEQLALDIERYLDGLPVSARKDTFTYRSGKFIRRHAVAVVGAGAIAAALLLGAGGVLWQAQETARERDAAFLARDQAEQIAKFLKDTLSSADPAAMGPGATVRAALDDAASRVDAELRTQPLVHASVLSTIGAAYLGLGEIDRAERAITRAMEERRAILGDEQHDMAESMLDLAGVRYTQERFEEAEQLLRHALRIFRSIRGDHNLDIARTANDLGAVLRSTGRIDEAEPLFRQALEIRTSHEGPDSLPVAETLNNLGGVLRARGDKAGTEQVLTEALRIRRALLPEGHARIGQSVDNLAVFYASTGDPARAVPLFREAVATEEKALGPDHADLAVTLNNLGAALVIQGEFGEAESVLRRALSIRQARLPSADARTAYTRAVLGRCLLSQTRYEEAEQLLVAAIQDLRSAGPRAGSRLDTAMDDLAHIYEATGRPELAAKVKPAKPSSPPDH